MRAGSKFVKGKMLAADYTIFPDITFNAKNTGGVGAVAGGFNKSEATTTLTLIENRSGVQIAATGSVDNLILLDLSVF